MIETIDRVTSFYTQLEQMIFQFQLKTGLRCPDNCGGICCLKENVYTSTIEMLPIAHAILVSGQSAFWLERLASASPSSRCIFYSETLTENDQGHCHQYTLRPMICRMFGFASSRGKTGERRFSTCKLIKQADKAAYDLAVSLQAEAPCFSNISPGIYGIQPSSDAQLLPINDAFKTALTRAGLYLQLLHGENLGGVSVA